MQFQNQSPTYDIGAIKEFFDIRIHELLPTERTRQQRINDFFNEYQLLKGQYPNFADYSNPEDFLIETESRQIVYSHLSTISTDFPVLLLSFVLIICITF